MGHLTKCQLVTHCFEVGSHSLVNLPKGPPQEKEKLCWNSGSTLDESTSTLFWGLGAVGGQNDNILRARKIFEFHLAHWASNSQILLAHGPPHLP